MIGDLLKQLFPALGRFIGYHTGRILHPQKSPATPGESVAADTAANDSAADPPTQPSGITLPDTADLDSVYVCPVPWERRRIDGPSKELRSNSLYKLWQTIPGGHKWTHYFPIYQSIFGPRRSEPLRVLEIGVLNGASLKLWRKYFDHPETIIVGIDITPDCAKFDAPAAGIRVRIGSQTDPAFLKEVVKEFGPFDLIIDDGSHFSSHIITSFNCLFADGLKDPGIYFVEDLHANYWLPWRDSAKSFLDVCKELLEHMNAHYRNAPPAEFLVDKASLQPSAPIEVPLITTMIKEIRFFDSIVAIYKARREHVPHYLYAE